MTQWDWIPPEHSFYRARWRPEESYQIQCLSPIAMFLSKEKKFKWYPQRQFPKLPMWLWSSMIPVLLAFSHLGSDFDVLFPLQRFFPRNELTIIVLPYRKYMQWCEESVQDYPWLHEPLDHRLARPGLNHNEYNNRWHYLILRYE